MRFRIALLMILTGLSLTLSSCFSWVGNAGVQSSQKNHSGDIRPKPSTGDSSSGETLYRASCIVCHGPQASGGIGPRLSNNPVLSDDQAFWKVVYEGRHVMPPLKGAVTAQQLADIRAWLQTLR
mgnify:CR=1 FL=1